MGAQNLPLILNYTPGVDYGGSQNLPLPSRIYPFFCDYVKCLRLSESTPPSQNIPSLIFNKCICATLPEYTPPSQNIPPFSKTICNPPRIYRPSQNIPPFQQQCYGTLPRLFPSFAEYTPFSTNILLCDAPRIYPSLPEYSSSFNNYVRHSQNLPLPPRIYPLFQQLYATLSESTPPFQNIPPFSTNLYLRPSKNLPLLPRIYPFFQQIYICDPPRIYPSLPEYTPTPFQQIAFCDPPRIYASLPEYTPLFNKFIFATLPEYTPPL